MDNNKVLHDLSRIAANMRAMSAELKKDSPDVSKVRFQLSFMADLIDKLYKDIEIKLSERLL